MSTANAKTAVEAMLVAAAIADDAIADLRDALATLGTKEDEVWAELQAVKHSSVGQGGYAAPQSRRGIVRTARNLIEPGNSTEPNVYATVLAAWQFLNPTEPE